MAAAVPLALALAVLEAAVPLAVLESDVESDFVVLDTASDVFVGDALEDVEEVSASNVNYQSWCRSQVRLPKLLPLLESSCLRSIKPSISLYDGGDGHAEVMEVRRKRVKRIWLSRSCWIIMIDELNEWNQMSWQMSRPGFDYSVLSRTPPFCLMI